MFDNEGEGLYRGIIIEGRHGGACPYGGFFEGRHIGLPLQKTKCRGERPFALEGGRVNPPLRRNDG